MDSNVVVSPTKDSFTAASDYISMVDPFLVEALQNPRHRLTILHMELDIQKFMQSPDQQQFEFQHFPTSYLRLAAHRVAQHYGLQTMIQENAVGGQGTNIIVRKKDDANYPPVSLSEIPAKEPENGNHEHIKFVIKPRPHKSSSGDINGMGLNRNFPRTVDERIEEYDKARARIFNSPSSSDSEDHLRQTTSDGKEICSSIDESGRLNSTLIDYESNSSSSRVAILRDIEKDRHDPDYDRSYGRYVRNFPATQNFPMMPSNIPNFQAPYVQYDSYSPQIPRPQAFINYRNQVMGPVSPMVLNQPSTDASVYMQRPTQSMMYAQSYDQFRHVVYQAPFYQQPLSFGYSPNYA